ncbi:MAG: ferric reductase-like transmembrane domain-containing protein [Candidatus Planktophila sp.]
MRTAPTYKKHSAAGVDWAAWLLGIGLGLTLALQATTMRASDINAVYPIITSISRLAALTGSYFAIVGIFLVARIPAVERGVGHDRLVAWHRKLGPWSLYLILAHLFLVLFGYAGGDHYALYRELWHMLQDFEWMWPALAGFFLMMLAGVTSYRKARAKMSYETWWIIHIYTYVAIAASFMHQVLNGQMFVGHPLNRLYWTALYIAMSAAVVIFRFGIPLVRSLRHNLVVEKVVIEGPGLISVIMRGRNLKNLAAEGGQFFGWRFLTRGHFLMSHPYSLSAAPTDNHLRITIKDLGDHSRATRYIKKGTRVFVEGPYGAFTAGRATQPHVVAIGGGVGITPIRALMDEFKDGVRMDVFYRVSKQEELILVDELDYLAEQSNGMTRVHYLVGSRKDYPMDAQFLKSYVPRIADCDIYICGPEALVETVREAAAELGVPKNRFHDEDFAFHPA